MRKKLLFNAFAFPGMGVKIRLVGAASASWQHSGREPHLNLQKYRQRKRHPGSEGMSFLKPEKAKHFVRILV